MSKEELRRSMPTVAAIVDEFRVWLEKGGKVVYASENGHVIDRREPLDEAKVFTIPMNYRTFIEAARVAK